MKKLTLEFVKEEYRKKGYQFLDAEYVNARYKHNIECNICNLKWTQKYSDFKQGKGCPKCARVIKLTKEYVSMEYFKKGYEFLDTKYIKNSYKHNIKHLVCGYIFKQKYNAFQNGCGCPECGKIQQKKTMLKKYGVDNPTKNRDIALKAAQKVNHPELHYHWLTSEEVWTQGSYEASTIYDLNNRRINYLWQPKTFTLSNGKTYRPDLYLIDEDKWIEIKGYFRKDALEKWTEFHEKICPNSELWDGSKLKEFKIIKG